MTCIIYARWWLTWTFPGLTINVLGKHDRDGRTDDQVDGGGRVDLRFAFLGASLVLGPAGAAKRHACSASGTLCRRKVKQAYMLIEKFTLNRTQTHPAIKMDVQVAISVTTDTIKIIKRVGREIWIFCTVTWFSI